jgi:hypothetical protein
MISAEADGSGSGKGFGISSVSFSDPRAYFKRCLFDTYYKERQNSGNKANASDQTMTSFLAKAPKTFHLDVQICCDFQIKRFFKLHKTNDKD